MFGRAARWVAIAFWFGGLAISQSVLAQEQPAVDKTAQTGIEISVLDGQITFHLSEGFKDVTAAEMKSDSQTVLFRNQKSQQAVGITHLGGALKSLLPNQETTLYSLSHLFLSKAEGKYTDLKVTNESEFKSNGQLFHRIDMTMTDYGKPQVVSMLLAELNQQTFVFNIETTVAKAKLHESLVQNVTSSVQFHDEEDSADESSVSPDSEVETGLIVPLLDKTAGFWLPDGFVAENNTHRPGSHGKPPALIFSDKAQQRFVMVIEGDVDASANPTMLARGILARLKKTDLEVKVTNESDKTVNGQLFHRIDGIQKIKGTSVLHTALATIVDNRFFCIQVMTNVLPDQGNAERIRQHKDLVDFINDSVVIGEPE